MLDEEITSEELETALKDMKAHKCPGSDSLSAEVYETFWNDISEAFLDAINVIFQRGFLSDEQKRGIITLIPKKDKDRRYMENWRPISLLNVDYKIIT